MSENQTRTCSLCGGTGWRIVVKDNREYAQKCECQAVDVIVSRGQHANIPPRFLDVKLDSYRPDKANPSQADAKATVEKFISDYPGVLRGLLLQGPTGVGKTRLLCTIAAELMKKINGLDIYYIDWNELVREMRFGEHIANRDYSSVNQLLFKLSEVDLLLFDELGSSGTTTPWVLDNIYYIFNKRYNNQKITVCATNYLDKSIDSQETLTKRVGERIRSRLYEMTSIIPIKGDDLRAHDRND